jgi:nanoRNase/pAp phosphatase (c-di-AMP/oligoRNAs hydrolase)
MTTKRFRDLITVLSKDRAVIIQTHDYPDHDAIAAGYALSHILGTFGYCCELCYGGELQSDTIGETIGMLAIPAVPAASLKIADRSQIVLVDGFAGNKNVTDLQGDLIGIVDHHEPPEQPDCPFADIRPDYGSCSTIVYQYYLETSTEIPRKIATLLLMGIMIDTDYLTRGVAPVDLAAFSGLFFKGDWERAAYVLRNCLSIRDLPVIRYAVHNLFIQGDMCFLWLEQPCRPELLGLLSDYFLGFKEIHFVVVCESDPDECRISVRSEDPGKPADAVIRRALKGIGSGGGHLHMSGGAIPKDQFPGEDRLRERFLTALADISGTRENS